MFTKVKSTSNFTARNPKLNPYSLEIFDWKKITRPNKKRPKTIIFFSQNERIGN